ncbi:LacI family transcriptional regulator [Phaeobacter inhibens]|uniref:Putative HTH-type transcriptional regulator n=1 Tax=Phaeobacter inhibens TaxID=221822 RepID=A0A2I7KH15_9RHOB|nr:LacI family transcriptional regulator [Phaeobacter inhibens]AUR01889.1 putative HTH-type transcriptional regulator [Phaeobacter inhibens]
MPKSNPPSDGLPRDGKKPTLKTIAKASGMAVPTVSRALSDAPDISEATKKKVREIADALGYVPNRAGVRLRTGRTNVISLVMSAEREMMTQTARLLTSLGLALRETHYHLNVSPVFPDDDPLRAVRYIVENQTADCVIFNQVEPEDKRAEYLIERNFPFATHGRTKWADQHPYYDFDNFAFSELSLAELTARGRKNIVLLAPPLAQNYANDMVNGARHAAKALGIQLHVARQVQSNGLYKDLRNWAAEKHREDPTIDGFLCASTNATMSVVAGMESCGCTVGQEFDVVAKEGLHMLKFVRPEIIVVQEDIEATGVFLAKAALQAIKSPDLPPQQFLEVPTEFVTWE